MPWTAATWTQTSPLRAFIKAYVEVKGRGASSRVIEARVIVAARLLLQRAIPPEREQLGFGVLPEWLGFEEAVAAFTGTLPPLDGPAAAVAGSRRRERDIHEGLP